MVKVLKMARYGSSAHIAPLLARVFLNFIIRAAYDVYYIYTRSRGATSDTRKR